MYCLISHYRLNKISLGISPSLHAIKMCEVGGGGREGGRERERERESVCIQSNKFNDVIKYKCAISLLLTLLQSNSAWKSKSKL